MGRRSKTQQLTDSILGQHLALSVAAHLARTQLVPDALAVYDGQHMSDMVDTVANALVKVAPLYAQGAPAGTARELSAAELEGAVVRRGATVLALKDGRTLSSMSIKRADLRQAIAILKAVGIPELRTAPPKEAPVPKPEPAPLLGRLCELEALLRLPLISPHVEKANAIAVGIAREAPFGRVANLAMQLISAVHEARSVGEAECRRVPMALARLRTALEEVEKSKG